VGGTVSDEYTEDQRPCLVAKNPCGCYVAASGLDFECDWQEIKGFCEEVFRSSPNATIEFRPVSFVRNGGLSFACRHRTEAGKVAAL